MGLKYVKIRRMYHQWVYSSLSLVAYIESKNSNKMLWICILFLHSLDRYNLQREFGNVELSSVNAGGWYKKSQGSI